MMLLLGELLKVCEANNHHQFETVKFGTPDSYELCDICSIRYDQYIGRYIFTTGSGYIWGGGYLFVFSA